MTSRFSVAPVRLAVLGLAASCLAGLVGCTSQGSLLSESVDYRSKAVKTAPLDIPPDLTQLDKDGRYQPRDGVITASGLQGAAPGATAAAAAPRADNAIAPQAVGPVRLMRDGQTRWLSTSLPAEAVFPRLRDFWNNQGFAIDIDSPQTGVLETDWAENRAKLPQDGIRRLLGGVLDSLYSTGERDRFRTRLERTASGGTEIYLVHRGMEEVYDNQLKERTVWQPRARDPQLEAIFLSRLMVALGASKTDAEAAVAAAAPAAGTVAPVARAGAGAAATQLPERAELTLSEPFDRAWRSVGLALDRNGFTVEDRDRSAGLYFVRYVDVAGARAERNFFQRLMGDDKEVAPTRYRVQLKAEGDATRVSVLTSSGEFDNSEVARRITGRLLSTLQGR